MRYSENDFIKKKQNAFFLHFFTMEMQMYWI